MPATPRRGVFLSAEWKNLLMANYPVDPAILEAHLPYKTELDFFNGTCYVSMVGFLFANTRLLGVPVPFHTTFEEVNLRFYVRYRADTGWRRGVVFIKEIVPRRMITFVANTVYVEKYATHPMRHQALEANHELQLGYEWKVQGNWNFLRATAAATAVPIPEGSLTEFITEHYWGYTRVGEQLSGEYQVDHPRWLHYPVQQFTSNISAETLYGAAFGEVLAAAPSSVFIAKGSPVQVYNGKRLIR